MPRAHSWTPRRRTPRTATSPGCLCWSPPVGGTQWGDVFGSGGKDSERLGKVIDSFRQPSGQMCASLSDNTCKGDGWTTQTPLVCSFAQLFRTDVSFEMDDSWTFLFREGTEETHSHNFLDRSSSNACEVLYSFQGLSIFL